jgi:hypothetical protein
VFSAAVRSGIASFASNNPGAAVTDEAMNGIVAAAQQSAAGVGAGDYGDNSGARKRARYF